MGQCILGELWSIIVILRKETFSLVDLNHSIWHLNPKGRQYWYSEWDGIGATMWKCGYVLPGTNDLPDCAGVWSNQDIRKYMPSNDRSGTSKELLMHLGCSSRWICRNVKKINFDIKLIKMSERRATLHCQRKKSRWKKVWILWRN